MNKINYNEIDLTLAIQLQAQFEEELRVQREKEKEKLKSLEVTGYKWKPSYKALPEVEQEKLSVSLVDPCWELLDPSPNIFDLFLTFNHQFFWGRLLGVEVKWSPRMTLCAGVCSYEGRGGLCSVRLSVPLLKLRPRKDLVETLLHEMIHAYLFVTHNNTDHDGHGPQFHEHMYRINKLSGTKISVYHSFHNEVAVYRQHVWICDGPCRKRSPYFGLVKRSMNRPPSPRDLWWEQHAQTCGGTYTKIKEPEGYGVKKSKRKIEKSTKDIRSFFPVVGDKLPKMLTGSFADRENRNESSGSSKKVKGNLSGLHLGGSSCSSGNVNQLDIQNASNAKVHDFSKSKGKVGSATKLSGIGASGGLVGSRSKTSNRIGSTTAVSVGSRTVVTKNKNSDTTAQANNSVGSTFVPFSGSGHSLGGSASSHPAKLGLVSRFDSNWQKRKGETTAHTQERTSESKMKNHSTNDDSVRNGSFIEGSSVEDLTTCPLCGVHLDSRQFERHITDCLGDWDADEFGDSNDFLSTNESRIPDSSETNCELKENRSTLSWKRDTKGEQFTVSPNNGYHDKKIQLNESVNHPSFNRTVPSAGRGELPPHSHETTTIIIPHAYSCPICDNKFSESEINQHANTHFD